MSAVAGRVRRSAVGSAVLRGSVTGSAGTLRRTAVGTSAENAKHMIQLLYFEVEITPALYYMRFVQLLCFIPVNNRELPRLSLQSPQLPSSSLRGETVAAVCVLRGAAEAEEVCALLGAAEAVVYALLHGEAVVCVLRNSS